LGAASRQGGWTGEEERKGEGKGGRGKWRGGEGRAPKLLLNQGPSELCYATEKKLRICHIRERETQRDSINKTFRITTLLFAIALHNTTNSSVTAHSIGHVNTVR